MGRLETATTTRRWSRSGARCNSELLDSRSWKTRAELANAIFEWIECWYNPKRRHSSIGMLSPVDYEAHHTAPTKITDPTPSVSGLRGQPQPSPDDQCGVRQVCL